MSDTSFVKILDSSTVIEQGNQHIVLIQDLKKDDQKGWSESPWIVSLLIPILVAAIVAFIVNRLSKQKNEIEINKLKEETKQLKKSFQPIVINTIQSSRDKVIDKKIQALFILVDYMSKFTKCERDYDEEGLIKSRNESRYLSKLWLSYNYKSFDEYVSFFNTYAYLFPDSVYKELNLCYASLETYHESHIAYDEAFAGEEDFPVTDSERSMVKTRIQQINKCIFSIRKDCHLESDLVDEFIEQNKL